MGNMPVLKDLIVDLEVHWNKVKAVTPWIRPEGPAPQREYIVGNEHMLNLINTVQCILCGACVSDCTSLEVDTNFLGPAALAKAVTDAGYDPVADFAPADLRARALQLAGEVFEMVGVAEAGGGVAHAAAVLDDAVLVDEVLVDVDEAELAESLELPGADLSDESLTVRVLPRQSDEFTCSKCFLVQHRWEELWDIDWKPLKTHCTFLVNCNKRFEAMRWKMLVNLLEMSK